jgi:hypothetical protein
MNQEDRQSHHNRGNSIGLSDKHDEVLPTVEIHAASTQGRALTDRLESALRFKHRNGSATRSSNDRLGRASSQIAYHTTIAQAMTKPLKIVDVLRLWVDP